MPPLASRRDGKTPPPAPRGSSPNTPQRPSFRPSPRWIVFFLVLLALNIFVTTRATRPTARVRVPYTPFFLKQVRSGNVASITSKGTAVQGTFGHKVRYRGSKATKQICNRPAKPAALDATDKNAVTGSGEPS